MNWVRKHRFDIGILGLYALLTLALAGSLLPHISSRLAGDDVDVLINPWADWWTLKALTEGHALYYTDYLFYPQGVSLVFHSFSHLNTAITLLLAPLLGYFPAYNTTILLAYALSGWGMYLLAKELVACRPAAFVAGLVFTFQPYHLFESSHPVLVTTQWMPLFALAFVRMLAGRGGQGRQALLAALWFVLTALASWHLMLMLIGWALLYLLYGLVWERERWKPGSGRHLLLLTVVAALALAPLLWPIVREQLTADATYMAVDVAEGRGNDLLSFFTPNRLHPVFGPLVLETNARIGYTRNSPAYLGYVALVLALIGLVAAGRPARFWWLSGGLFLLLSLGSQLKWRGLPLHAFHLPWAIPLTAVLRHPLRLNTLLFLSLALLVAWGSRWVYRRLASRKFTAGLVLLLLTGGLLFEYLVWPFPATAPALSPFIHQLAQEEGDFAVADFPTGRQADKYYMFAQTVHDKKITGGVVSRTPHDASRFVDTDPLLSAIQNENVPDEFIAERMAVLAAQGMHYILVHKSFLDAERMANWRKWLAHFPAPVYEDERLIAYRTVPLPKTERLQAQDLVRLDARLGESIWLRGCQLGATDLTAGDPLTVTLFWQVDRQPARDESHHVFVHLLDAEGELVAQHDGVPVHGERPTWSWWAGEVIQDEHTLDTGLDLPPGVYTLSAGMYDPVTALRLPVIGPTGEHSPKDRVVLGSVRVVSP